MIVAGTGHRPNKLGGYSKEAFTKLLTLAENILDEEFDVTTIISGMALGWDQALAQAAVNKNIPFIAAVPFFGQESMWPKESQEQYTNLLKQADDIVYVCDKGYAPWKMQVRNEYMVDKCDWLLALWDGSFGGTANCLNYARKQNKPIRNVWNLYKT